MGNPSRSFLVLAFSLFAAAQSANAASAKISLTGQSCQAPARRAVVQGAADKACSCIARAVHVLTKHEERVREMFKKGTVFPVYFRHREFYRRTLGNRLQACNSGSIPLNCLGRKCGTAQETIAYVRVFNDRAVPPIYLCDEFFTARPEARADVMAHEFGRLENIADGPAWDKDNIAVWDRIVEVLCDETNFKELTKAE